MTQRFVPIYQGYVFDLDGTLYLGDSLIEGADVVVATLRDEGASVVFLTNKPLETAQDYAAKLSKLGIPATAEDVITAIDALVLYLRSHYPFARILTIAEQVLIDSLRTAGFTVTDKPADADVVVVSFDRTFDYDKLTRGYQAVNNGAVIVATNPDPFCPTPDGGRPDCAAMLAALEACTGHRAEAIVGKPSVHMANTFLDRLGVKASKALMVGDRLSTDIAMGIEAGMSSALVLSGATTLADLQQSVIRPTHVFPDVRGLLQFTPKSK